MSPADEAAEILIRMLNTIAYGMGKRLNEEHKSEIRRACQLLVTDCTLQPLDDLPSVPRVSPAEAMVEAAERDPNYQEWRRRRAEADRR